MLFTKIIFGFLLGLGIGIGLVDKYAGKIVQKPQVLSEMSEDVSEPKPTSTQGDPTEDLVASINLPGSLEEDPDFSEDSRSAAATITSAPTKTPSKTQAPTLTPKHTQTPTPTTTLTLIPSLTPSPIVAVQVKQVSASEINGFIDTFAAQYGIDANVLRHIGVCESNLNPQAVSGPYAGIYQFGEAAWTTYRKLMGEVAAQELRFDAEESIRTAAYVISIGKSYIWPSCTP